MIYCYSLGYVGCFVNDHSNHEFNSFASHLIATVITPSLCIKACYSMGFSLSAIEDSMLCFCKAETKVFSVKVSDSICQFNVCLADQNYYCGKVGYNLVYEYGAYSDVCHVSYEKLLKNLIIFFLY